jgi:hypothetical protein
MKMIVVVDTPEYSKCLVKSKTTFKDEFLKKPEAPVVPVTEAPADSTKIAVK